MSRPICFISDILTREAMAENQQPGSVSYYLEDLTRVLMFY